MSRAFAITVASEQLSLDNEGRGETTYTVSNTTTRPLRAWPQLKPLGSTAESWIHAEGAVERSFSPGESQQFVVRITVPTGTATGKYAFRLNMISGSRNVEDESIEGPSVTFEVAPTPAVAAKTAFPWWLVAVAGIVVLGGGIAIALMMKPGITVPDLSGQNVVQASNTLASAQLRLDEVKIVLAATGESDPGTVFEQFPKPREKVKRDSSVSVIVRERPDTVRVPKVTRGRLADAINTLARHRLQATNIVSVPTTNAGDWEVVLEQEPQPDREVDPYSFITLRVGAKSSERLVIATHLPLKYVVANPPVEASRLNHKAFRSTK